MSEDAGGQSKTLVRGLSILNACSGSRSGLTLVEIAEATDLAPSTAHRLLATLEALSFLSVNSETGRWRIGVAGFRMGNAFVRSRDYVAQLRPLMIELSDQTGGTRQITDHVIYVLRGYRENTHDRKKQKDPTAQQ